MGQDEIKLVYYISLKKSNVVDINETLLQQLAKEMMLIHVDLVKNCSIPAVVGQSEQFICRDCEKPTNEYRDSLCEPCHKWHTDS